MDKAPDLLKIRTIVVLFLTSRDLATCCRVSKAWNASFAHMLSAYGTMSTSDTFRPFPSRPSLEQPRISMPDSTIRWYGRRICNLCYRGHVSSLLCAQLTSLHMAIAGVQLPNTVAPFHTQVPLTSNKPRLEP